MSSLIYDSFLYSVFRSSVNFDTDFFKLILVTSDYRPSKSHSKMSEVIGEVLDGNGYTRGGLSINITVIKDSSNNRVNLNLDGATWNNSTIIANGAIYYKVGSSDYTNDDDLICFVEFERQARSDFGSFSVTGSVIRVQN